MAWAAAACVSSVHPLAFGVEWEGRRALPEGCGKEAAVVALSGVRGEGFGLFRAAETPGPGNVGQHEPAGSVTREVWAGPAQCQGSRLGDLSIPNQAGAEGRQGVCLLHWGAALRMQV